MDVTVKTLSKNHAKDKGTPRNVTLWLNNDGSVSLLGNLEHMTTIIIDKQLIKDLTALYNESKRIQSLPLYHIVRLDNNLHESNVEYPLAFNTLTESRNYEELTTTLNYIAEQNGWKFIKDSSLFGGYYRADDGTCYYIK